MGDAGSSSAGAKRSAANGSRLDEAEVLDRLRLVGEAFRPAAPIDRRSLFSGRSEQISELFSIAAQPGQHAVIFGERGVGKTSLAAVTAEMLKSANMLVARATCDVSDDFGSVWRKALDELRLHTTTQKVGFTGGTEETSHSLARLLGDDVKDPAGRVLFADTIKTLSDRVVRATITLIGVADSVSELVREHRSVERALAQIHMPRMTRQELSEIATRGIEAAQMGIRPDAVRRIATLSQGLPHYTQLLTQLAAQSALAARRRVVTGRDVDVAVGRALERAQQSVVEAYQEATADTRKSIYPQVLLACALAPEDDFGLFAASDVCGPLGRILGKPYKTAAFARHLDEFSQESRGEVLQKHGTGRTTRYRFLNPLLQPYVAMRGVSEGVVRVQDLG
ncbi:MAG: ATP-binding protein [Actinobacteria bacterium]|nr:MAG: ATP-binding protein [Actinomycetota bacterium]